MLIILAVEYFSILLIVHVVHILVKHLFCCCFGFCGQMNRKSHLFIAKNSVFVGGFRCCVAGVNELGRARNGRRRGEQHDRQAFHLSVREQLLKALLSRLLAEVSRQINVHNVQLFLYGINEHLPVHESRSMVV